MIKLVDMILEIKIMGKITLEQVFDLFSEVRIISYIHNNVAQNIIQKYTAGIYDWANNPEPVMKFYINNIPKNLLSLAYNELLQLKNRNFDNEPDDEENEEFDDIDD